MAYPGPDTVSSLRLFLLWGWNWRLRYDLREAPEFAPRARGHT